MTSQKGGPVGAEAAVRSRGRPRKFVGRRPTWTVRLSADLGERVKAAAEEAGRSISEEIERRVDWSFGQEGTQYPAAEDLLQVMQLLRSQVERHTRDLSELTKALRPKSRTRKKQKQ